MSYPWAPRTCVHPLYAGCKWNGDVQCVFDTAPDLSPLTPADIDLSNNCIGDLDMSEFVPLGDTDECKENSKRIFEARGCFDCFQDAINLAERTQRFCAALPVEECGGAPAPCDA